MIPGAAAAIASMTSYAIEKRLSKHPERFGKGAIEGVAGPETANNAATAGCFVPLLTLGLPTNSVMALLIAALIAHGISPGPMLLTKHPEVFWGVIASMYIGNTMLMVLNLPLLRVFVSIIRIPYSILSPLILLFCVVGAYTLNSNPWDILAMLVFGVLGYGLKKLDFEPAPLILAFVLGPIMETSLRQALLMVPDRPLFSLVSSPISVTLYVVAVLNLVLSIRRKRRERIVVVSVKK
jgi:putative tricarboxylic transport membrane protein